MNACLDFLLIRTVINYSTSKNPSPAADCKEVSKQLEELSYRVYKMGQCELILLILQLLCDV